MSFYKGPRDLSDGRCKVVDYGMMGKKSCHRM